MSIDIHPLSETLLVLTGLFLVIDELFIKAITYNYSALGLDALNPYINHGWVGLAFIMIGLYEYFSHK